MHAMQDSKAAEVATDLRQLGAGVCIINSETNTACALLSAHLARDEKQVRGKGKGRPEKKYYVLNKISNTCARGHKWPVLIGGRSTVVQKLTAQCCYRTPDHGAVYIVQVDFARPVFGQAHVRVAVKHGFYEEADAYEEKTWQQLAVIWNAASVRILGGQLEKIKTP